METAGSDCKPEMQKTAFSSYFRFNVVLTAFRLLELGLALFFLFRVSARVPFAVRLSCEYSSRLLGFVARPLFVFVLCNAIIVALLAKPGRFWAHRPSADNGAVEELYEEIIKISDDRAKTVLPPAREAEEVVYEDKEMIVSTAARARGGGGVIVGLEREAAAAEEDDEECRCGLWGPAAEKRPRTPSSGWDSRESSCGGGGDDDDEDLSNEEFQRAIEAFIAKQLRFRREETLAIVLPEPHSSSAKTDFKFRCTM